MLRPHCGYVGGSAGPTCTVSRCLAGTTQPVSLAPTDHRTRLCDSVCPASPQVQGHPLHISEGSRCSCLACGDCGPTGEGCHRADMKTGFYSPYFIVPKKGGGLRLILDLCVLNRALHRLLFNMFTQKRIFRCIHP